MYSNNIVNFQESTTILNAHTKKSQETYRRHFVLSIIRLVSIIIVITSVNAFHMDQSSLTFRLWQESDQTDNIRHMVIYIRLSTVGSVYGRLS